MLDGVALARDGERVTSLQVSFGPSARGALCKAFDSAQTKISAEFYDLSDPFVINSINDAASRDGVTVELHVEKHPFRYRHTADAAARDAQAIADLRKALDPRVNLVLEDDPRVLMHSKAAVVDNRLALISTGNPTWSGFGSDGEVLISSQAPQDISDVESSIAGQTGSGDRVVAGPGAALRLHLEQLMQSNSDLRIATEGLSDPQILRDLIARKAAGHHDRVLIECITLSGAQRLALWHLQDNRVDVRALRGHYMHEKFVDDGGEIYLGSANLTHNGIDEGREIGVVAPACEFGPAADVLQARFDAMWSKAEPASAKSQRPQSAPC